MVLDVVHGPSDGVMSLSREAIKAGATKEEIAGFLRVAQYICGVGSIYTAAGDLKQVLTWTTQKRSQHESGQDYIQL